jgi:hypothetical protein
MPSSPALTHLLFQPYSQQHARSRTVSASSSRRCIARCTTAGGAGRRGRPRSTDLALVPRSSRLAIRPREGIHSIVVEVEEHELR